MLTVGLDCLLEPDWLSVNIPNGSSLECAGRVCVTRARKPALSLRPGQAQKRSPRAPRPAQLRSERDRAPRQKELAERSILTFFLQNSRQHFRIDVAA